MMSLLFINCVNEEGGTKNDKSLSATESPVDSPPFERFPLSNQRFFTLTHGQPKREKRMFVHGRGRAIAILGSLSTETPVQIDNLEKE
jgi:hypothetical protein